MRLVDKYHPAYEKLKHKGGVICLRPHGESAMNLRSESRSAWHPACWSVAGFSLFLSPVFLCAKASFFFFPLLSSHLPSTSHRPHWRSDHVHIGRYSLEFSFFPHPFLLKQTSSLLVLLGPVFSLCILEKVINLELNVSCIC